MIRCLINVKPCGVAPSPLLRRALAMSFEEDLEGGSMSKRLRNIGKPFRSIGVHRLNSTAVTSNGRSHSCLCVHVVPWSSPKVYLHSSCLLIIRYNITAINILNS